MLFDLKFEKDDYVQQPCDFAKRGNILLPILTRNMSSGLYYLHNVANDGVNRGVISDTRLSGTSHTQSNPPAGTDPGPSDVYKTFSTPSGAATNHTVEYFKMV